jgi:hypothetical protein
MRTLVSIGGAVLLTVTALTTPASVIGTASGSCGAAEGQYGRNNLASDLFPGDPPATPAIHFEVNYAGVEAPTTIGVIVRRNDELEDQASVFTTTAMSPAGSYRGSLAGSFEPTGGPELNYGTYGSRLGNQRDHNRNQDGVAESRRAEIQNGARTSPYTGVAPGLYVFYVYTGEIKRVEKAVAETFPADQFVADEKSLLGRFECAVADE